MIRDVPHCRSILACGMGGLILSVVFLTVVYPLFCDKVSQVKEIKVREYMQERYGIYDHSASMIGSGSGADRELSKTVRTDARRAAATPLTAGAAGEVGNADRDDEAGRSPKDALPPAKRR